MNGLKVWHIAGNVLDMTTTSAIGPIDIRDYGDGTASAYTADGHLVCELDYGLNRHVVIVLNAENMDKIGCVRKDGIGRWEATRYRDDHVFLLGCSETVEGAIRLVLNGR